MSRTGDMSGQLALWSAIEMQCAMLARMHALLQMAPPRNGPEIDAIARGSTQTARVFGWCATGFDAVLVALLMVAGDDWSMRLGGSLGVLIVAGPPTWLIWRWVGRTERAHREVLQDGDVVDADVVAVSMANMGGARVQTIRVEYTDGNSQRCRGYFNVGGSQRLIAAGDKIPVVSHHRVRKTIFIAVTPEQGMHAGRYRVTT